MKKVKLPEKLRSTKSMPSVKYFMYDPDEPEYPSYTKQPAAHAARVREGGLREFYKLEPVYVGSADFHNRIWTDSESGKRFISATEVLEHILANKKEARAGALKAGTYDAEYESASVTESGVVLHCKNGNKITIKKQ